MLSTEEIKKKILPYIGNLRVKDIMLAKDSDVLETLIGLRVSAVEEPSVEFWHSAKRLLESSSDSCMTMRKLSIDLIDDIIRAS